MPEMKIYQPSQPLRQYIRYYWALDTMAQFRTLTFPIGCPQLIFHKKSPLYIPELDCCQSQFTISGQVNFPAHIASSGDTKMIVAVFHPHTVGMFISTPPSAFHNLEICGFDLANKPFNDLASRIIGCENDSESIALLDRWLIQKINPTLNIRRMAATITRLLQHPETTLSELSANACLGKKQFERVFRDCVGMNPKEYSRVVRFQKTMWHMQQGQTDFLSIAYSCGYADQSHFIREFKAMSGYTPKSFLNNNTPYSDLFTIPTT